MKSLEEAESSVHWGSRKLYEKEIGKEATMKMWGRGGRLILHRVNRNTQHSPYSRGRARLRTGHVGQVPPLFRHEVIPRCGKRATPGRSCHKEFLTHLPGSGEAWDFPLQPPFGYGCNLKKPCGCSLQRHLHDTVTHHSDLLSSGLSSLVSSWGIRNMEGWHHAHPAYAAVWVINCLNPLGSLSLPRPNPWRHGKPTHCLQASLWFRDCWLTATQKSGSGGWWREVASVLAGELTSPRKSGWRK